MASAFTLAAITLLAASPAADGALQVPEASSAMLFVLGVAGVVIGRRLSMRSRNED